MTLSLPDDTLTGRQQTETIVAWVVLFSHAQNRHRLPLQAPSTTPHQRLSVYGLCRSVPFASLKERQPSSCSRFCIRIPLGSFGVRRCLVVQLRSKLEVLASSRRQQVQRMGHGRTHFPQLGLDFDYCIIQKKLDRAIQKGQLFLTIILRGKCNIQNTAQEQSSKT